MCLLDGACSQLQMSQNTASNFRNWLQTGILNNCVAYQILFKHQYALFLLPFSGPPPQPWHYSWVLIKSGLETLSIWFNVDDECQLSCTIITIVLCVARCVWCAACHRHAHVCVVRGTSRVVIDWEISRQLQPLESEIIAFSNFACRNDVGAYGILDICRNWMKWLKLVTLYFQLRDIRRSLRSSKSLIAIWGRHFY